MPRKQQMRLASSMALLFFILYMCTNTFLYVVFSRRVNAADERRSNVLYEIDTVSSKRKVHNNDGNEEIARGKAKQAKVSTSREEENFDLHSKTSKLHIETNSSSSEKWIKLSSTEMQPYLNDKKNQQQQQCTHKIQHCCIGQCLQASSHKDISDVLYKWNDRRPGAETLAKLSNVLDYLEERQRQQHRQQKQEQRRQEGARSKKSHSTSGTSTIDFSSSSSPYTCKISYFGDSLTLQQTFATICELLSMGYTITSCKSPPSSRISNRGAYGRDSSVQCEKDDEIDVPHYAFENENAKSCQKIVIALIRVEGNIYFGNERQREQNLEVVNDAMNTLAEYAGGGVDNGKGNGKAYEDGFVHIYNWSVHCNNQEDRNCMWDVFTKTLVPYVTSKKFNHWTFLYREHEPQHFDGPGGVYPGVDAVKAKVAGAGPGHSICTKITEEEANNWRNEEAEKIIAAYDLQRKIPVIRIFYDLLPLWDIHDGRGDCTHSCYNPLMYDLTWDRLLTALKELDQSRVSVSS